MRSAKCTVVAMLILLLVFIGLEAQASTVHNCILKARVVEIQKRGEEVKKVHPDVTFGGICYGEFYYAQIEAIELNNSFYLGNPKGELPYCEGLIEWLSNESKMDSDRPIGIKLCIDPKVEPPQKGDIIDIRYNFSIGKTDTKSAVTWKYLSLFMDRESRKAAMSKQCDAGDGNICAQLGQMYWLDKDVDKEIESYRKACQIEKGYCTYYINALKRTGREDELKTQ